VADRHTACELSASPGRPQRLPPPQVRLR
jgi:hypothetical protein